jgi:hypothetical protein
VPSHPSQPATASLEAATSTTPAEQIDGGIAIVIVHPAALGPAWESPAWSTVYFLHQCMIRGRQSSVRCPGRRRAAYLDPTRGTTFACQFAVIYTTLLLVLTYCTYYCCSFDQICDPLEAWSPEIISRSPSLWNDAAATYVLHACSTIPHIIHHRVPWLHRNYIFQRPSTTTPLVNLGGHLFNLFIKIYWKLVNSLFLLLLFHRLLLAYSIPKNV